jgi:hypothetical protein
MLAPKSKNILVTGDVVLDHHIYTGERLHLNDETSRGLSVVMETGGAALTQRLVAACVDNLSATKKPGAPVWNVNLGCELPNGDELMLQFPEHLKSYAEWKPTLKANKEEVWRVGCGLGYGPKSARDNEWSPSSGEKFPHSKIARSNPPTILVIDDSGAGFGHKALEEHWHLPQGKAAAITEWIVLKLGGSRTRTIGADDLWRQLQQLKLQQRLVVVVSVEVLRLMETQLSPGLSWEQSTEQLVTEIKSNPHLRFLRQCRHLVVTFRQDGAIWLDFTKPEAPVAQLIFDPAHGEGEWCEGIPGEVFGYNTCLTAALVVELVNALEKGKSPEMAQAITQGLSAMRRLREDGHGPAQKNKQPVPGAGFPVQAIVTEILRPVHSFARAAVPCGKTGRWSILAASQGITEEGRPLFGFARQVALRGESALKGVPHLRIGQLLTASRPEMESLRLLRRLMLKYREADPRKSKPLSIGVFGAPGAGKSFGVHELATGVFGEAGAKDYPGWMEFNLSQFKDAGDLIGAFHQVRDRVLQGFIPVVFWDEFDSRNYFWLQYLLAPMQDGKFQEGQITHPIGKCVFIFAGATASSFDTFGPKPGAKKDEQEFKLAKGPDFKSRLDASLNVLGPNPVESDIFYPIRRAILVRALLGYKSGEQPDIDSGLLTALLEVSRFRHGARSLEKLLEPLKAARQAGLPVRRSQLAADNQLALYVDPKNFHALCQRDEPFKQEEIVRVIAPAIHETWRRIARKQGWKPSYDLPYKELPPEIKRSNEAAARRIPSSLALVGLRLEKGMATKPQEKAIRAHLQLHIELLAESEHEGWMAHLISEGWRKGQIRDDKQRVHDCLVSYRELREIDREKDRDSVRHYPDFARTAKWKISFT